MDNKKDIFKLLSYCSALLAMSYGEVNFEIRETIAEDVKKTIKKYENRKKKN